MVFISSWFPSKKVTLSATYKTLEVITVEVKIKNKDLLLIGIYRPPKAIGENYFSKLEDELHVLTTWATQEWKEAIKKKKKYAKLFARNRTVENFKLKTKWRHIATTCKRKAIRKYWSTVSTELGKNPRKYYDTFKPFLAKEKNKQP